MDNMRRTSNLEFYFFSWFFSRFWLICLVFFHMSFDIPNSTFDNIDFVREVRSTFLQYYLQNAWYFKLDNFSELKGCTILHHPYSILLQCNLALLQLINGILLPKIVLTYCEKNCSSDQEKLLKFKAGGPESAKCLRSLEQFIQTVKGQNNIW